VPVWQWLFKGGPGGIIVYLTKDQKVTVLFIILFVVSAVAGFVWGSYFTNPPERKPLAVFGSPANSTDPVVAGDTVLFREKLYLCGDTEMISGETVPGNMVGLDRNALIERFPASEGWIVSFGKRGGGYRTPGQWREHHADYFASAIAMPNATFIPLIQEELKSQGITDGRVVEDAGFDEHFLARDVLPDIISVTYGVSRSAAYVKLRKTGFIVDEKMVEGEKKQLRIL
jgi:hypothetical protein